MYRNGLTMNINDLKLFVSTAEYESITKAAALGNTVQSNVSARIKYLEEQLGTKLLHRTTRRVQATDAGLKFLKIAKETITAIEDFKAAVHMGDTQPQGLIKIGCIHSTAALRAPGILQRFTAEHPDIDFKLKTATTGDLIKEVLAFKLDGAFVAGEVDHPDLTFQPIVMEELCLVASSIYPSLERLQMHAKRLKLVVFSKGCAYRELLQETLKDAGTKQIKFVEIDTLDGIINTVESGIGLTLLPIELIKNHYAYRNLVTFPLPNKRFAKCMTVFIRRKDYPMSDSYRCFFESIMKGYGTQS